MIKLGKLPLTIKSARIAASFWRLWDAEQIKKLCDQGLEVAELRLDMADVKTAADVAPLAACFETLPTIATLRLAAEGGQWHTDNEARLPIMLAALDCCNAVDVELESSILEKVAVATKEKKRTLIVSRHNFHATDTPAMMDDYAHRAFAAGADIYKAACLVKDENDFTVLSDFLSRWKKHDVIVIGMGDTPIAQKTRRLFPRCGSRIAYAAVCEESAPGQLSLIETAAAIKNE